LEVISIFTRIFHLEIDMKYWLCLRHDYASCIRALLISPSPYVRTYPFIALENAWKASSASGYLRRYKERSLLRSSILCLQYSVSASYKVDFIFEAVCLNFFPVVMSLSEVEFYIE
jgi:hypothetical protein